MPHIYCYVCPCGVMAVGPKQKDGLNCMRCGSRMEEDDLSEKLGEECQQFYADAAALVNTDPRIKAIYKKLSIYAQLEVAAYISEALTSAWLGGIREPMSVADEIIKVLEQCGQVLPSE